MLANLLQEMREILRWQPPAGVRNPDKSRNTRLFNRSTGANMIVQGVAE